MRRTSWCDGWWKGAVRIESPHVNERPAGVRPDLIVIHSISLPAGEYGGPHVQALFMGRLDVHAHPSFESLKGLEVSAHFVITRQGVCWQYVSCDRRAWHAGVSSWHGRTGCNDFSIGIELEGMEGGHFEKRQYQQLALLMCAIRRRYPTVCVAGHEHIAPGRKQDPGAGFDWRLLRRCLGWSARRFHGTPAEK